MCLAYDGTKQSSIVGRLKLAVLSEVERGCRYSYVDFAVTDFPMASDIIRKMLCAGRIPKRSWILFFDSDKVGRWIGIWPARSPGANAPGIGKQAHLILTECLNDNRHARGGCRRNVRASYWKNRMAPWTAMFTPPLLLLPRRNSSQAMLLRSCQNRPTIS